MKVIVKEPFKSYEVQEIPNEYQAIRKIIGGTIDLIRLDKGIHVVIHDEGKLIPLPANLIFNHIHVNDTIFGTALFLKVNEEGENESLSDEEIESLLLKLPIYFRSVSVEENEKIDPDEFCWVNVTLN